MIDRELSHMKEILLLAVITVVLTACGGKPDDKDKAKSDQAVTEQEMGVPDDIAAEQEEDMAMAAEPPPQYVDEPEAEDTVVIKPAPETAVEEDVEPTERALSPIEMVAEQAMKDSASAAETAVDQPADSATSGLDVK